MAFEVQGFIQTPPPLIDQTLVPALTPTSTIGNAPTVNAAVPAGATPQTPGWISTGAALTTDYGGTSDPNSVVEYLITCTLATHNGLGPSYGCSGPFVMPASTLVLPYSINIQCVRFEVFGLYWDSVPTGTQCTQDSGVCFTQGGAGQGVIYDTTQTGNGGGNMGWGVIWHSATGKLQFVAKQVNGTGGVGLSAAVDLIAPINGANKPFYLDMRWFAAPLNGVASIQLIIDNTDVTSLLTSAQSSWVAGTTTMPALNIAGSAKAFGFMPVISNNGASLQTANPLLHFQGARMRMGSIPACTLENQH